MDRLEAGFLEAHDKAQDYLEDWRDELSSLARDTSENICQPQIKKYCTEKCGKANSGKGYVESA